MSSDFANLFQLDVFFVSNPMSVCRFVPVGVLFAVGLSLSCCGGSSSSNSAGPSPVLPVANACAREAAGSVVQNPPSLFSRNGTLRVDFSYQTTVDDDGRNLFCFMTPDGLENPALYVNPGDHLIIKVTNNTSSTSVVLPINPPNCGSHRLTGSSLNIHFHGTNTSPTCHSDQVTRTLINSGKTFSYDIQFPSDEPPGLYWYHPHAHMLTEAALQGGGSGVIVVQGIQNFQPAVAGLEQQVLVIRDQNVAGDPTPGGDVPSWDLTLNTIPIAYPEDTPAIINMVAGQSQLWRVSNSSSDSILDLQVLFDGEPQNLQIVALDGVPTGSQDGTSEGSIVNATDILIPTAGRAEFIVAAPTSSVTNASLVTLNINTGPDGDDDPQRTLATIKTILTPATVAPAADKVVSGKIGFRWKQRFAGLGTTAPNTTRTLYFSENNPLSQFYITVDGATPVLFDPNNPPSITTTQGAVEDWTIQNQSLENHEFHIHQIHFLVKSQDNFPINGTQPDPSIEGQVIDTIQIPFWDGNPAHPFPSVTVRMDFRGADVGEFVYHCHIAEHEDDGMMAIINVLPSSPVAATIERLQLYLASLEWPFEDPKQIGSAWCVRGGIVRRNTRRFARPAVTEADRIKDANGTAIKLRE